MDEQFAIDVISGKRRGLWPGALCAGCEVASWGYAAAMALRNTAYDRNWLTRYRAGVPVISVGNLTTGGTGKTPVTAYLAAELIARGYRPGIVSRGYRQLDDRQNDEQMVLAQLLPDVPQVMNRDRVAGATDAVLDHDCDIVLLDDGFQHRRLARNLDLVLIDATRPWGFGRLLPRGLLREPMSSLTRADLAMITRCDQVPAHELEHIRRELQRYRGTLECVEVRFAPRRLRSASGEFRPLSELAAQRPLAFCGIGNPAGFQRLLADSRIACELIAFPDHHHYGPVDLRRLALAADAMRATCFVTTQKDLVKLPGDQLAGRPVWAVEIAAEIVAGGELLDAALGTLPQRSRRAA